MRSIFEDEDEPDTGLLTRVGPRQEVLAPGSITIGSVTGFERAEPGAPRKRTKGEAIARVQGPLSPLAELYMLHPFTRPYGRVLTAATYGFILLDPLDRLE